MKKKTTTKTPLMPRDNSQEHEVLKHLKRGWKISNAKAADLFLIYRLSAVINRLREKHWRIRTIEEKKVYVAGNYGSYKLVR